MSFPWDELKPALAQWGITLSANQRSLLERYLRLVLERGATVNLTADLGEASLLLRHAADGLAAAPILRRRLGPTPRLADLGSGGGFIGIALKVAWPEAEMALIEPVKRKFDFLNTATVALGLKGLKVVRARAGCGAGVAGAPFDAVLERALAPLPEALELALPLVRPGGLVLAYQTDAPEPGRKLIECVAYRLPRESRVRHLAIFRRPEG